MYGWTGAFLRTNLFHHYLNVTEALINVVEKIEQSVSIFGHRQPHSAAHRVVGIVCGLRPPKADYRGCQRSRAAAAVEARVIVHPRMVSNQC